MKLASCLLLLVGFFVSLVGCGGASDAPVTYPVSGNVTLDGEPLTEGDIIFRDASGKAASAAGKIENGAYSLTATAGKKSVVITATKEIPGKTVVGGAPDEPPVPAVEQYLPAEYNEKTTLEADVSDSGSNEFSFELKSK
ncbi:MAG: hypothetical protein CME31_22015 [Gimesia sp.]|jgi:hypothetical protein|uniref:Carboxypeptidase regulatory-like domain-containing protein n=1 Tax=Gimesia maris TaxID=122 RepID=A0A3D3RBV0_9PLAN|nr:hypothetical protein [Gimesia sp.]HCO25588.1 hypothetical protein [Gimesia maris]|tara:strand:- start:138212 stop:138631 length:420 start_codon:yes stop_codon:yes gene_type:complete